MAHRPTSQGRAPWRAGVLTLFPDLFPGPLGASLLGQALAAEVWSLETYQIREFGIGRHAQVDDTPAGGGAGMVMRADVLGRAIDHARSEHPELPALYLSPRGRPLDQATVRDFAAGPGVLCLAARFEGIDERVIESRGLIEVSIGDYVLAGGELAAMVLIEACVRLLPGVLGGPHTLAEESFDAGLLEYPHYTKPRDFEGRAIPDVLLSGDHARIAAWRTAAARRITAERRPDLMRQGPTAKTAPGAGWRVRTATPADAAAVTALLTASYGTLFPLAGYDTQAVHELLPLIGRANPELLRSASYYVAETSDGALVGCGGWTERHQLTGEVEPHQAHVRHFATDPDWLRRGIGRALLDRSIGEARGRGFKVMRCYASLGSEQFYRAAGFRRLGEADVPIRDGATLPSIVMELDLGY